MSRDNIRVHESYLPMFEMQPSQLYYHHYDPCSTSAVSAYQLTVDGAAVTTEEAVCMQPGPSTSTAPAAPLHHHSRKRSSKYRNGSAYDDDTTEDSCSSKMLPDKKQNHSEIEKRRRDKMNTYICELSSMIPMCGAMSRKLDKLTVLRMAVQHMRTVRGAISAGPLTAKPRPSFLSERELNALVLNASKDCFLIVVGCDRGRLLYVSASVTPMLYYDQSDLLGQSLFDILHPKDVAKVKEQLSSLDLSPRERLIDAKTMLPVKTDVVSGASRLCPGARRSFFCRIKCKPIAYASPSTTMTSSSQSAVKEELEPAAKLRKKHMPEKKYAVVQFTGYLKSWAPLEMSEMGGSSDPGPEEGDACNLSCLVAVGRSLTDLVSNNVVQRPPEQGEQLSKESNDMGDMQTRGDANQYDIYKQDYIKQWNPSEMTMENNEENTANNSSSCSQSCMKAGQSSANSSGGGKSSTSLIRSLEYISRHATDGTFLFVDHRVTLALGFLPQELLGTSLYEYVSGPELGAVARTHKTALLRRDSLVSPPYSFRKKDGTYVTIQTHFKPFRNPWTKDVECLVANNTVVTDVNKSQATDDISEYDVYNQNVALSEADVELQRLIDSQVESHKIGTTVAEEALRRSSPELSPELPVDLLQDIMFNQAALVDNILGLEASTIF